MKRYLILSLCLIMGLGVFAQKQLLKSSGNPTEVKTETSMVLSEGSWLGYDDGVYIDGIGGPTSFSWGIKLRAADIAGLGALTKVSAFDRLSTSGTFDIFLGGNAAPETWVLRQDYSFTGSMTFKEMPLSTPVNPNGKHVWIVFNTNDGVNYPASQCANTGDADGRWIYLESDGWFDVASVPLDATWMIRGHFENGTAGYQETSVLYTTYDLQSNGYVANRMYQNADGDVAVVATMSHQNNQSASDRGTGYSFSEGGDIDNFTYAGVREEANATGADMRTGWPSIAPYGANGEILVNHSSGLNYWIRETAGEGQWDGPYSIPNPTGLEYPFTMSWPRVTTSGPNNDIIHVVACAQYALADGSNINAHFYCRSTDGMNWDVDYSPLEATNEHIGKNTYSADDYAIASNGNVVAICYTTVFYNDVVVFKSTNNGQTWVKELVWENPYKGDWETDYNTITPEEATPTPVHGTVAVGPDGTVHVAFSVASYRHTSLGTSFSYYYGRTCDGIAYWNDTREPLTNIRLWQVGYDGYSHHSWDSVNFCGWMPFYENIGDFDNSMLYLADDYVHSFYGSCSGFPALSIDPEGNMAMAYSTLDTRRDNGTYYYRSAFVSYKPAGQEGWNVAVQDLSEDSEHAYDEVMWVSAASNTTRENEFWFSYLCDDTHGFYFGTGASQPYATENNLYVTKFSPNGVDDDDDETSPYYYSFENGFEGWTTINANGDDHTWYHSTEAGNHFVQAVESHTGTGHMMSESYCGTTGNPMSPDDYLVSPQKYAVTAGSKITFWACAQDENFPFEHFGVAVSTAGNTSASDFTTISEWTIGAKRDVAKETRRGTRGGQTTWTKYEVDLSAYAGQEVYIAIRHFNCSDQFILLVDDIEITSEECLVDFIMYDSYGDGWNGSTLTVAFDNAPSQILEFTEGSNITHTLAIATGTYVSVSFNTNGNNWPDECSYSIEYHNGGEIYNSNGQPSEGYNVGFVVNCGEEPEDPQDPEDGPNRKVIIEEFTGRNCPYCPDGHKVANAIAAANPGKVYPVVIHAGGFSPTSYPNLNTADGTAITNGFNVNAFPAGEVNRTTANPIGRGEWAAATNNQLAQVAEVSVSGEVTIDESTRTATITVELDYASSSAYSTNYLTVMMLQDSIWGSQSGGNTNPEQYVNGQYCHMHVLRDVITSTWGDAISNTTAGSHVTKTYIYQIPEVIGDPNGVEVVLDHIYFLAMVTETNTGVASRPVLNVNKLSIANDDNDDDDDDDEIVNHWTPDASLYPNTMTMVGVLEIDGVEQTDTQLEVGAFCGNEVRGSARLEYQSNVGRYMMFMTLYGNTGDNISFRLYDHNVDAESDYVCGETVSFVVDDILGGLVSPYVISFASDITQSHNLKAGWNWYSTYITVEGSEGLEMMQAGLGDDAIQIKSHNSGFVNYEAGIWFGGLTEIRNEEMYMIKMSSSHVLEMTGAYGDPSLHPITLGTNWKWIGYPVNATMSVNEAFSNITPNNGDYVKSQFHFAQYYAGLGWTGTLSVMEPGNGYMYQNTSGTVKTLVYPSASSKVAVESNVTTENNHWVADGREYATNMTVIAVVEGTGSDYEVAAFNNGECRGSARPIYVEQLDSYMIFMTVYGEDNDEITFRYYDVLTGEEQAINESMIFRTDATFGDVMNPYVMMLSPASIGESTIETLSIYPNPVGEREEIRLGGEYDVVEVYNSIGMKVAEYKNVSKIDGLETSGVYVVRIVEGDKVAYDRIVVK